MVLPTAIPTPPPSAVASYNYIDIAEGTGTVIFYGTATEASTGIDYHLLANKIDGWPREKSVNSTSTTTLDFDLAPFNLPQYVKGTAYFSAGIGAHGQDGTTTKIQVQLKHWDGSTPTNLTAEIESQTVTVAGGAGAYEVACLKLPITTEKHFKKGEILRLTVKLIVSITGASTGIVGHDPMNTSTDYISMMQVHVPFRIDL